MNSLIRQSVQALEAYVPGEQPVDPDIIKLNTNENPYPPSPRVAEALAAFDPETLRRYPDPACRELREALAELHGCAPAQIFVGNGSDEVLALCLRAFVERNGTVGYFEPSYSLYPILARIEDLDTCPVPLDDSFGWVDPDPDVSLFLLTCPNAPTSLPFAMSRIAACCRAAQGVVVIDEAYGEFADENALSLALSEPNVLVSRTLSKSYSLAGIRLGYAVGAEPLIAALNKIKDSYNVNRLTQLIALAAVRDTTYLEQVVAKVRATRERVTKALQKRGFTVAPSAANFLWIRPPDLPAESVFHALRAKKILVRYFPGPTTGGFLRVTIGTDDQMDRFLAALDREDI